MMQVRSLGREYPLEEGMATHSSILAWRIPWTGYSRRGREESDMTEPMYSLYEETEVEKKEPPRGLIPTIPIKRCHNNLVTTPS